MIALFIMTSTASIFTLYHTQMFYLVQIVFYPFSFYFCEYSFFICSVFNDIFYVNIITNIFGNNFCTTGLLNRDNKFLYCNCKVAGESIILPQQENKFKVYKIFITLENNFVFLVICLLLLIF